MGAIARLTQMEPRCYGLSVRTRSDFTLRLSAALAVAALLSSCKGCQPKKDATPPEDHVAKDAPAIFEVPDLGAIAKNRARVVQMLSGIATQKQIDDLAQELSRDLGFDPTSVEGLKAAGLPESGALAVELRSDGATLIVPVADAVKLGEAVSRVASARAGASKEEKDIGGKKVTVFSRSFGPETIPVLGFVHDGSLAYIGFGKTGPEAAVKAMTLAKDASIGTHPEYQALDKTLGRKGVARFIASSPGPLRDAAIAQVATRLNLRKDAVANLVRSLGVTFDVQGSELRADARVRLGEAEIARAKRVFVAKGTAPSALSAMSSLPSVLFVEASGDPNMLVELASEGDPVFKTRFDNMTQRLEEKVGLNLKKDILEALSGHGVVAVGVRDPAVFANPSELARNPAAGLWTQLGVGMKGTRATSFDAAFEKIGTDLESMQIKRTQSKASDATTDTFDFASAVKVDLVRRDDVVTASNGVPPAGTSRPSLLNGRPGIAAELRFGPVVEALGALNVDALFPGPGAIMVKGIVEKLRVALSKVEGARGTLTLVEDGFAIEGRLVLSNR